MIILTLREGRKKKKNEGLTMPLEGEKKKDKKDLATLLFTCTDVNVLTVP